jgi:multisubunit Na+/H+ antiporter MnhE subunit
MMNFKVRLLFNLFIYIGFCVLFPSFRNISALSGFIIGFAIVEYVNNKLT